jgi:hypothetical protein
LIYLVLAIIFYYDDIFSFRSYRRLIKNESTNC